MRLIHLGPPRHEQTVAIASENIIPRASFQIDMTALVRIALR
jgi:hypothetical protein